MAKPNLPMTDTIDIIDLDPVLGPDGREIWETTPANLPATVPLPATVAPPPVRDDEVVVHPGGNITTSADVPLSTLPTERLAAENGSWDRIVNAMQAAEAGQRPADEIVVQPGGVLVPVTRGTAGPQLSKVPEERMAASQATLNDLTEARRLDPSNVEGWTYIADPVIPGLQFRMRPVDKTFTFFTFRVASHSGHWFLSVLDPRLDDLQGHETHIIELKLGRGDKVPVVCRANSGSSHRTLTEVRGTAAKFAAYTSFRNHGHTPFSA